MSYRNTRWSKVYRTKADTLLTKCNWEQMANGARNCCLLLTNHKQTPTHEPHCSPWNIMTSSNPQLNYFPLFPMLSALRHVDSVAKFLCSSLQEEHLSPWSSEPWNRSTKLKKLCIYTHYFMIWWLWIHKAESRKHIYIYIYIYIHACCHMIEWL
jgi:hypothetical protein